MEKQRSDLNRDLEDLSAQLDDTGNVAQAQVSLCFMSDKNPSSLVNTECCSSLCQFIDHLYIFALSSLSLQADLNKKREAEIAKMRKDMEDQVMQSEAQIAQLRKKNNDAINDLNDQLDQAQKAKSK